MTPGVAAVMDRTKLSDRKAAYVLAAAAKGLGQDIQELNISRSSIRRARHKFRKELATSLKQQFQPTVPLVVHWDGKLLSDITGKELVDRLPVILSGVGTNQFVGVSKLISSSGEAQASGVAQLLKSGESLSVSKQFAFDTTASNTGQRNGVCVLLEQRLNKNLLHLASRHHILELEQINFWVCQSEFPVQVRLKLLL